MRGRGWRRRIKTGRERTVEGELIISLSWVKDLLAGRILLRPAFLGSFSTSSDSCSDSQLITSFLDQPGLHAFGHVGHVRLLVQ